MELCIDFSEKPTHETVNRWATFKRFFKVLVFPLPFLLLYLGFVHFLSNQNAAHEWKNERLLTISLNSLPSHKYSLKLIDKLQQNSTKNPDLLSTSSWPFVFFFLLFFLKLLYCSFWNVSPLCTNKVRASYSKVAHQWVILTPPNTYVEAEWDWRSLCPALSSGCNVWFLGQKHKIRFPETVRKKERKKVSSTAGWMERTMSVIFLCCLHCLSLMTGLPLKTLRLIGIQSKPCRRDVENRGRNSGVSSGNSLTHSDSFYERVYWRRQVPTQHLVAAPAEKS